MQRLKQFSNTFKDFALNSEKRQQIISGWKSSKQFSLKKALGFSILFYTGGTTYYLARNNEDFSIKMSFSRNISRFSGWVSSQYIPLSLRKPLFTAFAQSYNVIQEDMIEPLETYETFNQFFTRRVKPRAIDQNDDVIVSPADSKLLTIAEVKGDSNILVKGIHYKMGEFLTGTKNVILEDEMFKSLKLKDPESKIYQAIFYLNPGDYHRYHSPASIVVKRRNHILGYLAPVKESYIATHERVYEGNERVAIFGSWKHGQFTQVYVGATNVGSMTLEFDPEMKTNQSIDLNFKGFQKTNIKQFTLANEEQSVKKTVQQRPDLQEFGIEELQALNDVGKTKPFPSIYKQTEKGILVQKGSEIGRFNLGSTVVVIFEAKGELQWFVKEGDKVRYGQPVCQVIVPTPPTPVQTQNKNKK